MRKPLSLIEFGNLFKVLVDESDFKIGEVCELCEIDPQHPSRWRKGNGTVPTYRQIGLLSDILKKPVDYLIFGPSKKGYVEISEDEYILLQQDKENLLHGIVQIKSNIEEMNLPTKRKN